VKSSVAALRAARDATGSTVSTAAAQDPIATGKGCSQQLGRNDLPNIPRSGTGR